MGEQNPTILVTGASGHLGRRVVDLLLEANAGPLIATTRHPEKLADFAKRGVTVRKADFNDQESLVQAFGGAQRVLLISTDALDAAGTRLRQHRTAIAAAQRAGVKQVVYTSMPNPEDSPISFAPDHRGTEETLAKSQLGWTILRNNWYMDYLLMSLVPAVAHGKLYGAAGNGGAAYVTREDCALAAVAALTSPESSNRVYNITGPTVVSNEELVKLVSQVSGRAVEYVNLPAQDFKAGLVRAGLPEGFAQILAESDLAKLQGKLGPASQDFQTLTGRVPVSVAEFLTAHKDELSASPGKAH
jgi:NAD(P)H dehydrogenase (quinone)